MTISSGTADTGSASVPAGSAGSAEAALPNSLEHWAAVRPAEVAIVDGPHSVTWGAWNDVSDRLADALKRRGVGSGDIIAVRTQIRHEWLFVSEAAAKLGCALLPFNWRLTPAESRHILLDSAASVLIFDDEDPAAFAPAYEGLGLKAVISVDNADAGLPTLAALIDEGAPTPRMSAGRPNLIIYTSGTTGKPKGVAMGDVPQTQEWAEYRQSVREADPQQAGARSLLALPMHHGAGPSVCTAALTAGNTVVLMRRFSPEAALALIESQRINHWVTVPTMLNRIAALPKEVLDRYDVSSLRSLRTGAAPVPDSLKDWVRSYFGEVLHEAYGATEVGMIAHLSPQDMRRKPGSSGKPYRHVRIRIKDEAGKVMPVGEAGAIWVKSPTVIQRYLNAPLLGRDTIDEDGYFQVGDVGRLDADGYVYLTDRIKDMIISGGVNIYPAEIEAALIRHPAVLDVAVIGVPDAEFGEAVKAFVELKSGDTLTSDALLAFVEPLLASYKRPRSVEFVSELPRNTMGKVLKRELRNPYWKNQERNV